MKIKDIQDVGRFLGLRKKEFEFYGDSKAKIKLSVLERISNKQQGRLIFVTSINPTPSGEGKTTTSIGLLEALGILGKKATLCLRQPSLGPVFGRKGGAAGGGKAKLYPFEDINLHFTGDAHAIAVAHNLLAAIVDNHIYWGNKLKIDEKRFLWSRVLDINDRTLRKVQIGLNLKSSSYPRKSSFMITSASEIMAILALFKDWNDVQKMLGNIIVAYNKKGRPLYTKEFNAVSALLLLLKDALKPNLVQTIGGSPVLMHTGPFANIAHGNSSLVATRIALGLCDYVITEGGFGAELGFEKFVHIVARKAGFKISAVVVVVSLRALKYHGGVNPENSAKLDISALEKGCANLAHHIGIVREFGLDPVICINRFPQDKIKEIEFLKKYCRDILGVVSSVSEVYQKGARGGIDLAEKVLEKAELQKCRNKFLYPFKSGIKDKIEIIARQVYGASGVDYSKEVESKIKSLESFGFGGLPVNMAKTQFSLTHDPKIKGVPENWNLLVKDIFVSNGAGFLVPVTAKMLLLPGLPVHSMVEHIKYKNGKFEGLF